MVKELLQPYIRDIQKNNKRKKKKHPDRICRNPYANFFMLPSPMWWSEYTLLPTMNISIHMCNISIQGKLLGLSASVFSLQGWSIGSLFLESTKFQITSKEVLSTNHIFCINTLGRVNNSYQLGHAFYLYQSRVNLTSTALSFRTALITLCYTCSSYYCTKIK